MQILKSRSIIQPYRVLGLREPGVFISMLEPSLRGGNDPSGSAGGAGSCNHNVITNTQWSQINKGGGTVMHLPLNEVEWRDNFLSGSLESSKGGILAGDSQGRTWGHMSLRHHFNLLPQCPSSSDITFFPLISSKEIL